jgi:hypothetical protein
MFHFMRWVVSALAVCLLFGGGDVTPAATDVLDEVDEADAFDDLKPRNRHGHRAANGSGAAEPRGYAVNFSERMVPGSIGTSRANGAGGVSRGPRLPEHLAANFEARRLPGADPNNHAVSASPSHPSVREVAPTLELPREAVVIPGHPNFTQLTTGPPLAAALRFLPVVAPQTGRLPRFVAVSGTTP